MATRSIAGTLAKDMPHVLCCCNDCLEHAGSLVIRDSLAFVDMMLDEGCINCGGKQLKYDASIATIANVWRGSARDVFAS